MARDHGLLAATALLALANGFFNPLLAPQTMAAVILLAPQPVAALPQALAFFSIVLGALLTLVAGGVPAALYERVLGRQPDDPGTALVWFCATALLALPAIVMAGQLLLR
ncbi:hypothetical protein [Stappia sp.]|uniref:hypothetical protein n=1 Tax=Stappia sp. TaxID=1870903 RepID=UPI003D14A8BC